MHIWFICRPLLEFRTTNGKLVKSQAFHIQKVGDSNGTRIFNAVKPISQGGKQNVQSIKSEPFDETCVQQHCATSPNIAVTYMRREPPRSCQKKKKETVPVIHIDTTPFGFYITEHNTQHKHSVTHGVVCCCCDHANVHERVHRLPSIRFLFCCSFCIVSHQLYRPRQQNISFLIIIIIIIISLQPLWLCT